MDPAKSVTRPDDGSWLSAQQAVLPDGTEISNLSLINKKLPPLCRPGETSIEAQSTESRIALRSAIKAIEFAVAIEDGLDYLGAWLQRNEPAIRSKWPDAPVE